MASIFTHKQNTIEMFDLLRNAYLIPMEFGGKGGENPVFLTDKKGELINGVNKKVSKNSYEHLKKVFDTYEKVPRSAIYLADGYHMRHIYNDEMGVDKIKMRDTTGILLYAMHDTKEHKLSEM